MLLSATSLGVRFSSRRLALTISPRIVLHVIGDLVRIEEFMGEFSKGEIDLHL